MTTHTEDTAFEGSIPEYYDTYLVPLIFEPYALDMARRVASLKPRKVLELAAGTGVLTRALNAALPHDTSIVATDLNQSMLDRAQAVGTSRAVEWRQADAMTLPWPDGEFDIVVCQFGVMFFPDKPSAFAEARRVLALGGTLLFNVWDRIEENEFADIVTKALTRRYPAAPLQFLARTPHGYHDRQVIERDVRLGGFAAEWTVETLALRSRASAARVAAIAYCRGTPLRGEIEALGDDAMPHAIDICTDALAKQFGHGAIDGKIQAHIASVI